MTEGPTARDPRRRFGSAERVALFIAADGRCVSCGNELPQGWHGDHVDAWSSGGATDVINGQALCPKCNLKKGKQSMSDAFGLREWQQEAREFYHSRNGGPGQNFLVVATPGAGKTTFALTITQDLIDQRAAKNLVVVVPTSHLKRQWAQAAHRMGIQLDDTFVNANAAVSPDFDGVVTTYHAVASAPLLWRRQCSRRPTLVIFDEIHHAGDGEDLAWGQALKEAFEPAARRLLLSGTPFRSDAKPIPFVQYEQGRAVPGYNYDYGMALADGGVVRPAVFPAMDGESHWRRAGEHQTTSISLADTDEKTVPPALRAALDPTKDWIPSVLKEANAALTLARADVPDAGGLVVASDQSAARAYANILESITGERPSVAVSDEPEASKIIKQFAEASTRWIVAVQMVAEGVDIPRLAVGVYASRIRTQMYFIQVVGRFVRMRGLEDETTARVFIPSIEPLLTYARDIEKTVDAVLAEQEKRVRETQDSGDFGEPPALIPPIEVVGSSPASHHATIASGTSITTEEKNRAEAVLAAAGTALPRHTTPEAVALILRLAGDVPSLPEQRQPEPSNNMPLSAQKLDLRNLINRKVGRLAMAKGVPHSHIHGEMNKTLGNKISHAPLDSLHKRLNLLDKWLKELS
ncbi:DEAD/DEAH box helicase [Micromonospora sp. CPCC 206060]|uniref:DEAD/DEAH box helicase n=1 Tax=Micromonospora sp. CPCC 206060 TaxID=3122406 RepID=UPI002FF17EAD